MKDIVERLEIKAGVMEMGERIQWGSDTALMREAAAHIATLTADLARLTAELERVESAHRRAAWRADSLAADLAEIRSAATEVLRISDRKHDAWDRLKSALSAGEKDHVPDA